MQFTSNSQAIPSEAQEMKRQRALTLGVYQTQLVEKLLAEEVITYDDAKNIIDEDTGEFADVFNWISANLSEWDMKALYDAGIPYIDSDWGQWVGRTDFGSAEDLYFLPQYLNALYPELNKE